MWQKNKQTTLFFSPFCMTHIGRQHTQQIHHTTTWIFDIWWSGERNSVSLQTVHSLVGSENHNWKRKTTIDSDLSTYCQCYRVQRNFWWTTATTAVSTGSSSGKKQHSVCNACILWVIYGLFTNLNTANTCVFFFYQRICEYGSHDDFSKIKIIILF